MLQERLFTDEDYCALPDDGSRYQLVQGELIMSPSPNRLHQKIQQKLGLELGIYLKEFPIGELYFAPLDVFLERHNVYQPDLVYVANDRRQVLSDRGIEGAPTLVVEILSPSTAELDLTKKKSVYTERGIQEIWFIDPVEKTLTVHDLAKNDQQTVFTKDDTIEPALFPGLTIRVSDLF